MQNMDLTINTNLDVTSSSAGYGMKAREALELWNNKFIGLKEQGEKENLFKDKK